MALDFTNADPNDPNGIYSLDTSRAFDAWVNDDWSVVSYSQGDATKKGLKNKVRLATAVTNEGKKYEVVIDERGNPISQIGATTGTEPPVVQEWRTKQAQGQRQQDQGENKRVSVTYEGTGSDRKRRTAYQSGPDLVEDAPETAATSPAAQRTAREEAEIARNAALPPDQDPRPETDAQRAERADATIKAQGAAAAANAKANEPQITIKAVKQPDGSTKNVQVRIYPGGREEVVPSAVPGEAAPVTKPPANERGAPVRGGDNRLYYPVQRFDPATNTVVSGYEDEQGKPTGPPPKAEPQKPKYTSVHQDKDSGKWYGLTTEGRWEEMQGGPGATTGPKAPTQYRPTQIIVGAAQDGLRQSYDDIQAEVDSGRQTPAWGENRRKEVFETAQLTVNEAHLHEQSRQFNQSLSYNVANSRMQNQQGVLESALRSALSINGKIKKGSSAGAELFRGLFNLGMRMQQDSGINDIRPGGGQSSIPGAPGARGAPGQPPRAGSPATRPPMDIGDAKALAAHADQEATNIQAGLEASGAPRTLTPSVPGNAPAQPLPVRDGAPVTSTPYQPSSAPRPWSTNETGPSVVTHGQPAPAVAPPVSSMPEQYTRTDDPVQYGPQAMTQPEPPQFAAMEALRMKQPQIDPLAAPQIDPMQGMGEMPAALTHTQIAATPPWLLPQDRLADLVGQYGEDAVFGWPGMPRSEVMA
jgi:hypothetical protein